MPLGGCLTLSTALAPEAVETHALKAPEFEIKGATPMDQRWIDQTVEAGVAALDWPRPGPRPPEWDKPLAKAAAAAPVSAPARAAKKPSAWSRVKSKFKKKPADKPLE